MRKLPQALPFRPGIVLFSCSLIFFGNRAMAYISLWHGAKCKKTGALSSNYKNKVIFQEKNPIQIITINIYDTDLSRICSEKGGIEYEEGKEAVFISWQRFCILFSGVNHVPARRQSISGIERERY